MRDEKPITKAIRLAGGQGNLALLINRSQAAISKLASGVNQPSAETAVAIDRALNGQVTRAELRPDLWGQDSA